MPLTQNQNHRIEEIYALPATERAELLDGQLYYMAPPSRTHQIIVVELATAIRNYIRSRNNSCEVDIAPFAVFLFNDDTNYVEPDISVVCDRSKLSDKGCHGAPDWVIEVVSPGSRSMDYYQKLFRYQRAGVREYWIVDYPQKRVIVYQFEKEEVSAFGFDEMVRAGIFEDLEIDFAEIGRLIER